MTGPWIRLESPIGNRNSCGRGRKILYYIRGTHENISVLKHPIN